MKGYAGRPEGLWSNDDPVGKEQVMPRTLPLAAAQPKWPEIVVGMVPGEELVLTADGEPVAIVTRPPRTSWPCQPGTAKDRSFWIAPDFDALLELNPTEARS